MSLDELSLRHHSRNAVPIPKFLANDHNVLHHSTSSIIPKKLAIKYDRPMLVLFYLNGRHGMLAGKVYPYLLDSRHLQENIDEGVCRYGILIC